MCETENSYSPVVTRHQTLKRHHGVRKVICLMDNAYHYHLNVTKNTLNVNNKKINIKYFSRHQNVYSNIICLRYFWKCSINPKINNCVRR